VDLGPGAQDGAGKAKLRTGVLHDSPPPDLAATDAYPMAVTARDWKRLA
jgi:hypothetical protein